MRFWGIKYFCKKLWWKLFRKDYVYYDGYNCGLCGKWVNEKFQLPSYDSAGEWWDTWGMCEECAEAGRRFAEGS